MQTPPQGGVFVWGNLSFVIAGHSRPKDGVASLAYDPAIQLLPKKAGCPDQARA
jgi:hypothetical protein